VRVYVPTCSAFPLSALRDEARHLLCKSSRSVAPELLWLEEG